MGFAFAFAGISSLAAVPFVVIAFIVLFIRDKYRDKHPVKTDYDVWSEECWAAMDRGERYSDLPMLKEGNR